MAQKDDDKAEQRTENAFADFMAARPYRELWERLAKSLPPAPKIPPARVYRDAARRKAAREARAWKVGRAFQRYHATLITLTVGDVIQAKDACEQAAEYAERERSIDNLVERFQKARAVWNGTGAANPRALEVCKILFGARRGRRPTNKTRLRYAWEDFTTCENRRPAADNLVGFEWWSKTWADLQLEPPEGAAVHERIMTSLHRLTAREREAYAVRVIQRLFKLNTLGACVKALYRARIPHQPDLPELRHR